MLLSLGFIFHDCKLLWWSRNTLSSCWTRQSRSDKNSVCFLLSVGAEWSGGQSHCSVTPPAGRVCVQLWFSACSGSAHLQTFRMVKQHHSDNSSEPLTARTLRRLQMFSSSLILQLFFRKVKSFPPQLESLDRSVLWTACQRPPPLGSTIKLCMGGLRLAPLWNHADLSLISPAPVFLRLSLSFHWIDTLLPLRLSGFSRVLQLLSCAGLSETLGAARRRKSPISAQASDASAVWLSVWSVPQRKPQQTFKVRKDLGVKQPLSLRRVNAPSGRKAIIPDGKALISLFSASTLYLSGSFWTSSVGLLSASCVQTEPAK